TGQKVNEVKQHSGAVRHVRFQPKGGKMLASVAADKTVRVWDPVAPGKATVVPLAEFGPSSISWSPDGQSLAIGGTGKGEIMIVGPDGTQQKLVPGVKERGGVTVQVMRLAFTTDGKELVWGGIGLTGHAGVIEVASGRRRVAFPHHDNTVGSAEVTKDGR